jgi:hypothetical protein
MKRLIAKTMSQYTILVVPLEPVRLDIDGVKYWADSPFDTGVALLHKAAQ